MKDKKVLIGVALLLAAAFWFYIKPNFMDAKPAPVYTDEQIAAAPKPTVQLEERVLNLRAPATAPNYVKAAIALEFADPHHKWINLKGHALVLKNEVFTEEMEPDLPRIWDIITSIVGSRSVEQVATTEGREALKQELMAAINKEIHHEQVQNVYFVTFITQ